MNIEYTNIVVGSNIVEKNGKILLIKEKSRIARGKWNLPAGKLRLGESIISCAKREGKEETGFKLKPLYLIGIYQETSVFGFNVIIFVFKSKFIGGKINKKEVIDVKWLSINEIRKLKEKGQLRSIYIWKAIKDYKKGKKIPISAISIIKKAKKKVRIKVLGKDKKFF